MKKTSSQTLATQLMLSQRFGRLRRLGQKGFSLIELMIAISIGLFIALGLMAVMSNMLVTFRSQDGLSELQDNQRLTVTMLTTTIQSAGYFVSPLTTTRTQALAANGTANADGTTFVANQVISGTTSATDSDTINVRYQVDVADPAMNCLGQTNATAAALVWTNSFAINASNELTCSVNGATAVALVGNVEKMKIVYAVDTSNKGMPDTYLDASAITTGGYWKNIYGVQLRLTFINPAALTPATASVRAKNKWVQNISLMNIR